MADAQQWRYLRQQLDDLGADPVKAVEYLLEFRARMKDGITQEKALNTANGIEHLYMLVKFPDLELRATTEMLKVYQWIQAQLDKAEKVEDGTDTDTTLVFELRTYKGEDE